jgi:hypothetical protein
MTKSTKTTAAVQPRCDDPLTEHLRGRIAEWLTAILDAEITEVLGTGRYARTGKRRGYRHATRSRTVTTSIGSTTVAVPRGRLFGANGGSEWRSSLLPRYARRTRCVDEGILGAYLAGANTRRLKGALVAPRLTLLAQDAHDATHRAARQGGLAEQRRRSNRNGSGSTTTSFSNPRGVRSRGQPASSPFWKPLQHTRRSRHRRKRCVCFLPLEHTGLGWLAGYWMQTNSKLPTAAFSMLTLVIGDWVTTKPVFIDTYWLSTESVLTS